MIVLDRTRSSQRQAVVAAAGGRRSGRRSSQRQPVVAAAAGRRDRSHSSQPQAVVATAGGRRTTFTPALIDRSDVLGVSIPERGQAALTWRLGSTSGAEIDKLASAETFAGDVIDVSLVAWLECRVRHDDAVAAVAAARPVRGRHRVRR